MGRLPPCTPMHYSPGYPMHYFQNADTDECALGISGCNQVCTNTIGSYACSCYLGYQLTSDNRICAGKHMHSEQ